MSLGAAAPGSCAPSHLLPLHACRDLGPHARGQQALAALLPAGTDSAQGQPSVGAWPGLGQQWQRWRDRKSQGPILRGCHGGRAGPGIRKRPSPGRPRCTLHLPALASCFDGPRNQSQGFIHVYSGPCTLVHSPGAVRGAEGRILPMEDAALLDSDISQVTGGVKEATHCKWWSQDLSPTGHIL